MLIQNNIKIAIRNIIRNKLFSFINITGLTLGLTCCLIIVLFVKQELNYDRCHKDYHQIYRTGIDAKIKELEFKYANSPAPLWKVMKERFPEIIETGRIRTHDKYNITVGDRKFVETRCYSVDSTIFDILTFNFIHGSAKDLIHKQNVFLTRDIAVKYFGSTKNALGKSLEIEGEIYKVASILENSQSNTHFKYDILLNLPRLRIANQNWWLSDPVKTYFKLDKSTDYKLFEKKLQGICEEFSHPIIKKANIVLDENTRYKFFVQPLSEIHFTNFTLGEFEVNSDKLYVRMFSIIGLFILLIACINFSNLSTASASKRSKEIGIKKSIGSGRGRLMTQFFSESIFISFIAFIVSIILIELILPSLNSLLGIEVKNNLLSDYSTILIFFGICILTGILAGLYSAVYMSSFNPVKILKGTFKTGNKSKNFRSVLVVIQFTVSIFLIISTLVVREQISYVRNKDLGYNKENLVVLRNVDVPNNFETFRERLLVNPAIKNVSFSSDLPGVFCNGNMLIKHNDEDKQSYSMRVPIVDYEFKNTMKINMVQGRFFSPEFASDSMAVVLNETAVRDMNYSDPIGKQLKGAYDGKIYTIIGVMKNYHSVSLRTGVSGFCMYLSKRSLGNTHDNVAIRIIDNNKESTLRYIESVWKEFSNNTPFTYNFLEDELNNLYTTEDKTMKVFSMFSVLAIIIACLGLLGLVSFTTEQRIKEIGVRKTLGASVISIIKSINLDLFKLIAISYVIASFAGWYFMSKWLEGFKYRIDLSVWYFVTAAFIIFIITALTISKIALRAARQNPVTALRYE